MIKKFLRNIWKIFPKVSEKTIEKFFDDILENFEIFSGLKISPGKKFLKDR